MRILINDHAGHPFQVQLSRCLAKRGHDVLHTYCALLSTPRGALIRNDNDPDTFKVEGVLTRKEFSKYSLMSRFLQEKELGRANVTRLAAFQPDVCISANTPLGAQTMMINECRQNGIKFVFWAQDLLGVGIRNNVRKKLPILGNFIGLYYCRLEQMLLRRSDEIVIITDDFQPIMRSAGIPDKKIHVIENWAPLEELPVKQKTNQWSFQHGLDKKFCFLYSGTLGMKHNPELIVTLALAFKTQKDVAIVVITEGIGAEFLKSKKEKLGLSNLILFPFQPFRDLPDVLATGDVLLAILEPDAGVFAVPSKVLTCLCAQRPLLLAVPPENLASVIVTDSRAGFAVSPSNFKCFTETANKLYQDGELRNEFAMNGRIYAEKTFDIERITDKFENMLVA
ncbi:MAG: glycosyltransferase family 4 protein [Desulfobacteraceae bacterium]|nr:glycosyltransferase family 4 protein [Desulfobacteraceae bacterium]